MSISGLALPRHIAIQKAREERAQLRSVPIPAPEAPEMPFGDLTKALSEIGKDKDIVQAADAEIPEGLPQPGLWRVTLMPVCQRLKTKGSNLWLPDESLDVDNWTHMLWKVCKVGPFVYRGPAYLAVASVEELEAERPKPGELWLADPKAPRRFHYQNMLFIVVNDDQLWGKVDPDRIDGLKFKGTEL